MTIYTKLFTPSKVALVGLVFSSIFFSLWSVTETIPIVRTIAVTFLLLGLFVLGLHTFSDISSKKRHERQEKALEAYNQGRQEQAQQQEKRIQAARDYLAFANARLINDNKEQEISDEVLIDDILVIVAQLEQENLDENVIHHAVRRFLATLQETKYSFIFSVRREILKEIVSDTIMKNLVVNNDESHQHREFTN